MTTSTLPALAFDDTGGEGPLVVLLPGAGDIRQGYSALVSALSASGYRVVNADLPGHGTSPTAPAYGVVETADALVALIEYLDAGPAVVVATSFSPAAAALAASRRPELFRGLVAISPHLTADTSLTGRLQKLAILVGMRGPWAGPLWGRLYRGWYKANSPVGLDSHILALQAMLTEPARRDAVRATLVADRAGVEEAVSSLDVPTLFVFGSVDDHFGDPAGEAAALAGRTGGESFLVSGAGHYPHIEFPEPVAARIGSFLDGLS